MEERERAAERVEEAEERRSRERELVGKEERSESWDLRSASLVLMRDHLDLKFWVWGIESRRVWRRRLMGSSLLLLLFSGIFMAAIREKVRERV